MGLAKCPACAGGCPAYPNASFVLEDKEYELYPLVTAVPESQPPLAQGVFIEQTVELNYKNGQQVWLASHIDKGRLGDICTDDVVEVAVSPRGQTWHHDFRSPDRQKILVHQAVDITHLFVPGVNIVTLTLTDLTGPALSTSGYVIVVVNVAIKPTATTLSPMFAPRPRTATLQPVETATPMLPTATLTPTPVFTLALSLVLPATPIVKDRGSLPSTTPVEGTRFRWGPVALNLGFTGLGLGAILLWLRSRRRGLPGTIDLYRENHFLNTVVLAHFRKDVVRLGKRGDVVLTGEQVADQVARLCAHHPAVALEILDPQDPSQVQERYVLHHGETHWIGDYRLEYKNYQQTQFSGGFSNVFPYSNK